MQELAVRFWNDTLVQTIGLLVVLDIALGVLAAVAVPGQAFRLSYLADWARTDGVKILAVFLLYAGYVYAGNTDLLIPGFDMEIVAKGAAAILIASLVASILNSVRDLGVLKGAPDEIAGPDPASPTPTSAPPQ